MLLSQIITESSIGEQSLVQWLVSEMRAAYAKAESAAIGTYETSGSMKVARMHAGAALGKWFASNVINSRGNSISAIAKQFGVQSSIPELLGTHRQREEEQFSNSGALKGVLDALFEQFRKRGYADAEKTINSYQAKLADTLAKLSREDAGEQQAPAPKPKDTLGGEQRNQAVDMINQVLAGLPRDKQHDARAFLQRRGYTLQALQQWMSQNPN